MKVSPDGRIAIASSGILYGWVTVGGTFLVTRGLGAFDIAVFFLLFSLLPAAPILIARKDNSFLSKAIRNWRFLSTYAFLNTFLVVSLFWSLNLGLSPAVAAFLLYSQPVWTVIFERIFFGERITSSRLAVIALALAGVFLLTDPVSQNGKFDAAAGMSNSALVPAELLALLGSIFLSLWIIFGRKGRLGAFADPLELTTAVRGSTLSFVLAAAFITLPFLGNSRFLANTNALYPENLFWLFVFAIVAGLAPDFLFYVGINRVKPLQAGVILLLEPVSSAVISVALSLSSFVPVQVGGAALILLSNYFASASAEKGTR